MSRIQLSSVHFLSSACALKRPSLRSDPGAAVQPHGTAAMAPLRWHSMAQSLGLKRSILLRMSIESAWHIMAYPSWRFNKWDTRHSDCITLAVAWCKWGRCAFITQHVSAWYSSRCGSKTCRKDVHTWELHCQAITLTPRVTCWGHLGMISPCFPQDISRHIKTSGGYVLCEHICEMRII